MPKKYSNEYGFIPVLLLIVLATGVIGGGIVLSSPVMTQINDDSANVKGVFLTMTDGIVLEHSTATGAGISKPSVKQLKKIPQKKATESSKQATTIAKKLESDEELLLKELEEESKDRQGDFIRSIDQEIDKELELLIETANGGTIKFENIEGFLDVEFKDATPGAYPSAPLHELTVKVKEEGKGGRKREHNVRLQTQGNRLVLNDNGVAASTQLPIELDPLSNELMVTTKKGTKTITVMPDAVARALKQENILSETQQIELIEKDTDGDTVLLFNAQGEKKGKVFGFVPFAVKVNTEVNAETGAITSIREPRWVNIFSSLISK